MKPRLNRIALVAWRGISYEEVVLEEDVFVGLTGQSGAGKTTVAMCLAYALLPDRKTMRLLALSSVQDLSQANVDQLAVRIDPEYGFAYVALDIRSRDGSRVIAGIHVAKAESGAVLTPWHLENADENTPLHEYMRTVDGDEEAFVDLHSWRADLARRSVDLRVFRTISEYGELLYDVGILPTSLDDLTDRSLYARLLESTFRGGLSEHVTKKLKDYLLPEASRVPEALTRLQQCASQLSRTKRALADASRHLALLKLVYETAKQLVCAAIWSVHRRHADATQRLTELQQGIASYEAVIAAASPVLNELAATESLLRIQLQQLKSERQSRFNAAQTASAAAQQRVTVEQAKVTSAAQALVAFEAGQKLWSVMSQGRQASNYDELLDAIDQEREQQHAAAADLKSTLARLDAEMELLVDNRASRSAALADRLGGTSIVATAAALSLDESRAVEMQLAGLTEGVVGATLESLSKLTDDPSLPDAFWLLDTIPSPKDLHRVGDWHVLPASVGHVVTSDRRRVVLGEEARRERRTALAHERQARQQQLDGHMARAAELKAQSRAAADNADAIRLYLSHAVQRFALEQQHQDAVQRLADAQAGAREALAAFDALVERYGAEIGRLTEQLAQIDGQRRDAEHRRDEAARRLVEAREEQDAQHEQLGLLASRMDALLSVLGPAQAQLLDASRERDWGDPGSARFGAEQTGRLNVIVNLLRQEREPLADTIATISSEDPVACASLWPALIRMLRDRLPIEVADEPDEDLLQTMQQTRQDLERQLEQHEEDLRVEATCLPSAVAMDVRRQTTRINELNKLASGLEFGNVIGLRFNALPKRELMAALDGVAAQLSLLVKDQDEPVHVLLEKLFREAYGATFDGDALTDYRTYMDVSLQVQRKGAADWEMAANLSGGEAIGGGLAATLMLARSLHQAGPVPPEQFTPIFIADEVQRLSVEGHKVIVDLCRRQGFQMLVTAIELEPAYDCAMYVLHREYKPRERVVMRRAVARPSAAHGSA